MTDQRMTNVAASIRARLLNGSRERGEEFQSVLTRYASERLLYRLTASRFASKFVLKGATLYLTWPDQFYRPTRDLDLLGRGDPTPTTLAEIFSEICEQDVTDDGLRFLRETVNASSIREDQEYGGVRIFLDATLGTARIAVQVDIGFGDAISPAAQTVEIPGLLNLPAVRIAAYPPETVVAEKFEALVRLGTTNSRLKDFYDIWVLARCFPFDNRILADALSATFERRATPLPIAAPTGLSDSFGSDVQRNRIWVAFLLRVRARPTVPRSFFEIILEIRAFILPAVGVALR